MPFSLIFWGFYIQSGTVFEKSISPVILTIENPAWRATREAGLPPAKQSQIQSPHLADYCPAFKGLALRESQIPTGSGSGKNCPQQISPTTHRVVGDGPLPE